MLAILVYTLLSAACFYVAGESSLFAPVREKLPESIERFLACPFCSGFWYGLAWSLLLRLDVASELAGDKWPTPIVVAIISIITTPLVAETTLRGHVYFWRARTAYDNERRGADAASGGE